MKGQGIGKSVHYIEIVLGEKFPFDERTRLHFKIAREIRNSLVHNDGTLEKSQIKLIKATFPQKDVLKVENGIVVLSYEYAFSLIRLNELICKQLKESCEPITPNLA